MLSSTQMLNIIAIHIERTESTDRSVGRASDSLSQGRGFDPQLGRGVVSLSKTLHPHCIVLIKLRKPPQNDWKIVDRDVKPKKNRDQTSFSIH